MYRRFEPTWAPVPGVPNVGPERVRLARTVGADPDDWQDSAAWPLVVMNTQSARDSRNILHDVYGAEFPAVSFRPPTSRKGTLEMLFADEAEAWSAEQLHLYPGVFAIRFPVGHPMSMDMDYIVDGPITRSLDPESRKRWLLNVAYREARAPRGLGYY